MDPDMESKPYPAQEKATFTEVENAAFAEKATAAEYRAGAIAAENVEHSMTVIEAVKAYPMASFWAFIMSFTIVRCPSALACCAQSAADSFPDHGVV
jgi:SP family general alpha glucoside:H+ symporter-like MFS transporter